MYVYGVVKTLCVQDTRQRYIHRGGVAPPGGFQQGDGGWRGQMLPQALHAPAHQLLVQGLDQIIRGFHGEPVHGEVPLPGRNDDGKVRLRFPNPSRNVDAVHSIQKDIQKKPVTAFWTVARQKILAAGVKGQVRPFLLPGTVIQDQICQYLTVNLQIFYDNQMQNSHLPRPPGAVFCRNIRSKTTNSRRAKHDSRRSY